MNYGSTRFVGKCLKFWCCMLHVAWLSKHIMQHAICNRYSNHPVRSIGWAVVCQNRGADDVDWANLRWFFWRICVNPFHLSKPRTICERVVYGIFWWMGMCWCFKIWRWFRFLSRKQKVFRKWNTLFCVFAYLPVNRLKRSRIWKTFCGLFKSVKVSDSYP